MELLPLHIEYLLTRHDCVIVPGIGAFIATDTEAYFDFEEGTIHPRLREISFNSSVVTDDGLLSHSIARREGLAYEEARHLVATLADRMISDLNEEGEVSLGMTGRLVKDSDGLISFQPRITSAISDLLPELKLTGKEANSIHKIGEETDSSPATATEDEENVRIIRVPADRYVFTISKRAVHAAAMLITILTIGISLMIPINHDNEQKASVLSIESLFHQKVNTDLIKKDNTNDSQAEAADTLTITEPTIEP